MSPARPGSSRAYASSGRAPSTAGTGSEAKGPYLAGVGRTSSAAYAVAARASPRAGPLSGEAAPGGAVEDEPAVGGELRAVIPAGRVGIELEHAPGGVDGAGDGPPLEALLRLPDVDDHGVAGGQLLGHLVDAQVLDPALGLCHQVG